MTMVGCRFEAPAFVDRVKNPQLVSPMLSSDLRFALRSLSRSPGFALAVIVTLGLGIGANTAIFSVVRGVMLRPLPNRDGDRLLYLRKSTNAPGGDDIAF